MIFTCAPENEKRDGVDYRDVKAWFQQCRDYKIDVDPPCSRRRTTNTRRTRTPKSKLSFMEMPYFNHCMLSKRHNSGFFMPF